jgi:predicted enzyme related to lactoylglutathione lyase
VKPCATCRFLCRPQRSRFLCYRFGTAVLSALFFLGVDQTRSLFAETPALPPLTTVSGSPRLPGKFVWADFVTDDVAAARRFYSGLFGWGFQNGGDYLIVLNNERPICGMFQLPHPKDQSAHPRWFGYISVKSVDQAQRTVAKLGGRVVSPPRKFSGRGEQAVFADPEGALFGVIKSSSGDPEDCLADPGDWVWIQLLSKDARKAGEFYHQVGGYDVVENTQSNRVSDLVLVSEGYARATVRTIPEENRQVYPNWLPFVRVSNVKDSVARATQLGGKILFEPKPEYLGGKVAVVSDPTGGAIGLLEWSEDLVKGGGRK